MTALLEHLDPEKIPHTGGVPTQVVVGITLEALRTDLATATVTGHGQTHDLTAEQTRRLACQAQILPAVFGGKSQIIDAGRTRRLFSAVQRTLIQQQWVTCIGEGCTVPAEWCDLHHLTDPWARGGNTDLADGVPACGLHHGHLHAPHRYRWQRLPTGRIRFHRRE